jgi:hypothetical protein
MPDSTGFQEELIVPDPAADAGPAPPAFRA